MVEILTIIHLSRKVGAIAAGKGHSRALYIFHFVVLWFLCEFAGLVFGAFVFEGEGGLIYLFGLAGAVIGALLGFTIVNSLPDCTVDEDDLPLDLTGRPVPDTDWNDSSVPQASFPAATKSDNIQLPPRESGRPQHGGGSFGIQTRELS